jgi:tetratricopeptide (TPR) repeat protein
MRHAILVALVTAGMVLASSQADGQADDSKEPSREAEAALKERDRLSAEVDALQGAGKTSETIAAAEAMLAVERRHLGNDHLDVAGSLGRLAGLQAEREDVTAAKASHREALAILRKSLGESHWRVGDARRALEDLERLAGMDRERRRNLTEATRLNAQVEALFLAGKSREAFPPAKRVEVLLKEVLGERHPDYLNSLNNLATLHESQGSYTAAKALYQRVLAVRKEVLGERHPDYAQCLDNLAGLFHSQGEYAAARPLYERALAARKEVLGERNSDYANSLNNLGLLLDSQGDHAAARPLLERAMTIKKDVLGERHPGAVTESGRYPAACCQ